MESFLSNLSQGYAMGGTAGGQQTVSTNDTSLPISGLREVSNAIPITEMKPGESFQGEIVAVQGEEVQLKLANSQYLTARLEGQIQLALGQSLYFQVQSNKDSRIVLKPIYMDLMQQQVSVAALKAAGLPVNGKNTQMVASMIENGMPIDKSSLTLMYRQILQHPQADLETLMKLNKLQMPVTDSNLMQYESYKNQEHSLLAGVREAATDMLLLYDNLQGDTAEKYMSKLLQFLSEISTEKTVAQNSPMPDEAQQPVQNAMTDATQQPVQNAMIEAIQQPAQNAMTDVIQQPELNTMTDVVQQTTQKEALDQPQQSILNTSIGEIQQSASNEMPVEIQTITTNAQINTTEHELLQKGISQETLLRLQNTSKTELPNVMIQEIEKGTLQLHEALQLVEVLDKAGKEKLYKGAAFRELLKGSLQEQWTLSPDDVAKPEKLQEFYRRLVQQSTKLAQLMNETVGTETTQGKTVQNIRENIEFMNQMNQVFQYVQLPLKFTGSQAHGELYVYTNKKNLAKKEGTLTAFLHLDMEHLGPLDVKIALQTENNLVTTEFYLEESMISFMESHINELTKRLEGKGYHIKTSVGVLQETQTAVEQIEKQMTGGITPLSYQSFDVRM